jgi:broad specificity phosphatase PhoE
VTTTIHLVRHAAHELLDRVLVGRDPSVSLSGAGVRQAQALGKRFAASRTICVQSSPQLRARQTAEAIAQVHGLPLTTATEVDELDVGTWSGRSFADLDQDPQWRLWNSDRSRASPPGGESMHALQRRIVDHLTDVADAHRNGEVVIVSHAEPIRAAVLHYLELSLDAYNEVQVAPASVTTILVRGRSGEIILNNDHIEDLAAT